MTKIQIDRPIEELLSRLGVEATPPIPLERIATHLGVSEIRRQGMLEDGALVQVEGRSCILLRADRSPARQRFTLAHELAHVVLADRSGLVLQFRNGPKGRDAEENLCDNIAAALLMPHSWVQRSYETAPKTLDTVRQLAQQCEVSLAAALVRLVEVLDWRMALLRWTFHERKFRLISMTGLPSYLRHEIVSTRATHDAIASLRAHPQDVWHRIPLEVRGSTAIINAHVSLNGSAALALFDYRQLTSNRS